MCQKFVPKLKKKKITASDVDEVLPGGFVDLYVSVPDVMLVPLERHLAVGGVLEEHERLAVAPALRAQAEGHAAPENGIICNLA